MQRISTLLAVLLLCSASVYGQDNGSKESREFEKLNELIEADSVRVPALLQAILRGETEVVKTLVAEGEDVNEEWSYEEDDPWLYIGYRPLELATLLDHLEVMRVLLDNGAETERVHSGYPYTVPVLAYADNVKTAQLLIDYGANAKSWVAETPLLVVLAGNVSVNMIKLLIDNGADPSESGEAGAAPLHFVKDAETAQLLIDHGANIHDEYDGGGTPLHIADNAEVAKVLIDNGADVNGQSVLFGHMPLHAASYRGKKDVVHLLLDHGADVNATNNDGATPLLIALLEGHDEVADLLRRHGGVTAK